MHSDTQPENPASASASASAGVGASATIVALAATADTNDDTGILAAGTAFDGTVAMADTAFVIASDDVCDGATAIIAAAAAVNQLNTPSRVAFYRRPGAQGGTVRASSLASRFALLAICSLLTGRMRLPISLARSFETTSSDWGLVSWAPVT